MILAQWRAGIIARLKRGTRRGITTNAGLRTEPLEPRLLLSAEFLGGAVDANSLQGGMPDTEAYTADQIEKLLIEIAQSAETNTDPDYDGSISLKPNQLATLFLNSDLNTPTDESTDIYDGLQAALAEPETRTELIFINSDLDDYQQLVDDIRSKPSVNYQIFVLDANVDGVEQITNILAELDDIDAIHLLSHGTGNSVNVGNTLLSDSNLQDYLTDFSAWQNAFDVDADFLVYGCNLAANIDGVKLLDRLSTLTGLDVAASDDLTGSALLGGDWDLEFRTGQIESADPFSLALQEDWQHVLDTLTSTGLADLDYVTAPSSVFIDSLDDVFSNLDDPAETLIYSVESPTDSLITSTVVQQAAHKIKLTFDTAATGSSVVIIKATAADSSFIIESFTVTVGTVNTAPTATNLTSTATYTEGDASVAIDDIVITDDDAGDTITATLTLNDVDAGVLTTSGTATYDGATGIWTITGTVTDVNTALAALTFTPNTNYDLDTFISSHIEDQDGAAPADGVITLDVTPVNDPPAITGDLAASILEAGTYTILAADLGYSDVDNVDADILFTTSATANGKIQVGGVDALTFTGTELTAGQVTFVHDGSETTTAAFNVNVEDANADTSVPVDSTFNFTVTPVNDPPAITGDLAASILEAGTYTILAADLGYTDVDNVDADILFTTSATANGKIQVGGVDALTFTGTELTAGQVTFVHDGSETTTAAFNVNVEDANADASVPVDSTFNFTVTPVNDPPAITGDLAASILEAGTYTILAADLGYTDVDNVDADILFTTSATANGKIQVGGVDALTFTGTELTAGQVTFVHDGSETTTAAFNVNVEDANADTSVPVDSTFNFTVTPVNDPPAITGDLAASILEAGTYTILAADLGYTDVDNVDADILFTTSATANGKIQVGGVDALTFTGTELTAGQVTFVHDGSETTTAAFNVNVEDANADTSVPVDSTFNFTVTPVNDPPAITGDLAASILEAGTYTILAADLGYSDVDNVDADILFTTSATANGKIQVGGVDALTFTGTELTAGQVTFVHDGSETTTAAFNVNVEDANADTSVPVDSTFNFTVTPVNDPPAITGDLAASILEAGTYTILAADLGYTDVDNVDADILFTTSATANGKIQVGGVDALTFTGTELTAGQVTFVHDGSETTTAAFNVNVEDANADASVPVDSTFNFTVTPANDPPTATNLTSTATYTEGDASVAIDDIVITDVDTDPAQTLTATLTLNDVDAGILTTSGTATYDGATGIWTITGTVTDVNTALAALTFTPNTNYDLDTFISSHIEDQDGATPADGVISLDVTPANDPPTATNLTSTATYTEGDASVAIDDIVITDVDTDPAQTLTATLTLNDVDAGILTTSGTATYDGATGIWTITGTVTDVNTALAALTFTPNTNYDLDTFISSHIEDQDGATPADGVISLDVTTVDTVPTANNDNFSTDEDTLFTNDTGTGVLANDAGADISDTLSVVAISNGTIIVGAGDAIAGDSGGQFQINGDGSFTFDPGQDFQSLAAGESVTTKIFYDINDQFGVPATATLEFTVIGVNDRLTANSDNGVASADVVANVTANAGLLANDSDIDTNDSLRIMSIANDSESVSPNEPIRGSAGGYFTIQADGSYSFDPENDFIELPRGQQITTSVQYVVSDAQGDSQTASISIVVAGTSSPQQSDITSSQSSLLSAPLIQAPLISTSSPGTTTSESSNDSQTDSAAKKASANDDAEEETDEETQDESEGDASGDSDTLNLDDTGNESIINTDDFGVPIDPLTASLTQSFEFGAVTNNNVLDSGAIGANARAAATMIGVSDSLILINSPNYKHSLDSSRDETELVQQTAENIKAGTLSVTAGISIGYVLWLVRSGVIMGSVLSTMPAWRLVDPLPILSSLGSYDSGEEESIEDIVQSSEDQQVDSQEDSTEDQDQNKNDN